MARPVDIFQNPYYNQLQATASGAMSGSQFGPYGAAAGAIVGTGMNLAGNYANERMAINSITPNVPQMAYNGAGQPLYNLGSAVSGFDNRNDYGKNYGKKWGAAGLPLGIGTAAILAPIGARIGRNLHRRAQSAIDRGAQTIEDAQRQFNQANIGYNQNYLARQQYEDQFR